MKVVNGNLVRDSVETRDSLARMDSLLNEIRQRTRSAATGDTLLSCPTDAEWAKYGADVRRLMAFDPGKTWTGVFKPALDALPRPIRDEVLAQVADYRDLPANGEGAENSPTRWTEFPVPAKDSSLRQMRDSMATVIGNLNAAAKARWAGR